MKTLLALVVVVVLGVLGADQFRAQWGDWWPWPRSEASLSEQAEQLKQERETLKNDLARVEDTRVQAADREDLAVTRMNLIRDQYVAGDGSISFVGRTLSMDEAREQLVRLNRSRKSAAGERVWADEEVKRIAEQLQAVEERLAETETAMRLAPAIENRKRSEVLVSMNREFIDKLRHPEGKAVSGPVRDWEQLEKDAAKLAVQDVEKEWLDAFIAGGAHADSSDVSLLRDALSD